MYHFSDPLLQELVDTTGLPKTIFTQKLKNFYKTKKCTSSQGCPIAPDDAKTLFLILHERISDISLSSDEQYNAARLIRISLSWKLRESIYMDIFDDVLGYIKKNAMHANGNVRNEVLFLLSDFLFLMYMTIDPRYPRKTRNKKEQACADRCVPPLIVYHKHLALQEQEYIQKHRDELSEDDM